jgi:RHS repeat-associated protein
MPSGPASLKGLGDSFSPNMSTGTGNFSVPIQVPPGFLAPSLALTYTGGKGKGVVGQSWELPVLEIYRSRDKGAPRFDEEDRFAVRGPGLNDELVRVNRELGYYRLKNEGAFALFVRNATNNSWTIRLPSGQTVYLGEALESRTTSRGRAFRWHISRQTDRFGHTVAYRYFQNEGHTYLEEVTYQLHAASQYQNTVAFVYEGRPDPYTDYSYGAPVTTALRLARIQVLHGSRPVRSYKLGYRTGVLFSLLSSVEMEGEGGLTMPPLTFQYVDAAQTSALQAMQNTPPLEGILEGWAELADVNADGLPDLIEARPGQYRYFENLDGRSWGNVRALRNSPDRGLAESGTLFADIDGDGFRDLVHTHGDGFRYYPGNDVDRGVFRGFRAPVNVSSPSSGFEFTDSWVKMTDLNSDGRIDLLWQKPGQHTRLMNYPDNTLREEVIPNLPRDVDFSDPRLQLTDFNGDGELDFVLLDIGQSSSRVRVWFGLGRGEYLAEQQVGNVPTGEPSEFHLHDVNHDGQADLLRVSGSWATYYLNRGNLRFGGRQGEFYGLPSAGSTQKLLFSDMNGNGSIDLVFVTSDFRIRYLDFAGTPNPGLLTRIDNGMGLVTDIGYRMSTEFAIEAKKQGNPWVYPLPLAVPLLSEIRSSDSLDRLGMAATETLTTYEYRDGYYDGKEREFRGFETVWATEWGDAYQETQVTETRMHVGRNRRTGADEEILKGKPYSQVVRNDRGQLYSSVETNWAMRWMCQEDLGSGRLQVLPNCRSLGPLEGKKDLLVAHAVSQDVLTATYEKTNSPRFTAVEARHDAWGRVIEERKYGEVHYGASYRPGEGYEPGRINPNVGADEQVTKTTFTDNLEEWIIGLPTEARLEDLQGTLFGRSQTFYDNLPLGQVSRGLVTRSRRYHADEGRWIDVERIEYDGHGNRTATVSALDDRVELAYETHGNLLPALERVEVGPGDWVTFSAEYDLAYGAMVSSTDANGHTWRFVNDGLGRLQEIYDPVHALPASRFSYTYGTPSHPISTTRLDKLVEASGRYHSAWTYSDGAGRARQTKETAEAPHGFVASSWTHLSARGKPVLVYDSFSSPLHRFEEPPTGVPVTVTYLDALGRAVEIEKPATDRLPGGGRVITQYFPFETRAYTEKESTLRQMQNPEITRVDGLGRIREVEKYNDMWGEQQRLRWRIGYNTRGDIVRFADPLWNGQENDLRHLRRYTYDSLGRLTQVQDPNAGTTLYSFDDLGRIVHRVDPLGQEQEWIYGRANRLERHVVRADAHGAPDYEHRYHYDAPAASSPLTAGTTNLRGKLAWLEFPTGEEHFAFDALGRLAEDAQRLWNPTTSSFEVQERDVHRRGLTYRADGAVTELRAPGGLRLNYDYNERGALVSLGAELGSTQRSVLNAATYDHRGAVLSTRAGNGVRTCSRYNERAELVGFLAGKASEISCSQVGSPGAGFHHLEYSRGYDGVIDALHDLSATDTGLPRLDASYQYDTIHQLISSTEARGSVRFTYDAIQNMVRQEVSGLIQDLPAGTFRYGESGAGPNAITSAGAETFEYDAAGQMLRYKGYDLRFDAQGRLVEASNVATGVRLVQHYDDAGERRIALVYRTGRPVEVHRFIASDYQVRNGEEVWFVGAGSTSAEIVRSKGIKVDAFLLDQLTAYVNGTGMKPKPLPEEYMDLNGDGRRLDVDDLAAAQDAYIAGTRTGGEKTIFRYYTSDHLGGTTHVTDSIGDLVSHQRYHAYGKVTERSGQTPQRGYIGRDLEADQDLGLIRMGARYYAPEVGRWITPDPLIGQSPKLMVEKVLESNLYSYGANNPVVNLDPSGLEAEQRGTVERAQEALKEASKEAFHWAIEQARRGYLEVAENSRGRGQGSYRVEKEFAEFKLPKGVKLKVSAVIQVQVDEQGQVKGTVALKGDFEGPPILQLGGARLGGEVNVRAQFSDEGRLEAAGGQIRGRLRRQLDVDSGERVKGKLFAEVGLVANLRLNFDAGKPDVARVSADVGVSARTALDVNFGTWKTRRQIEGRYSYEWRDLGTVDLKVKPKELQ